MHALFVSTPPGLESVCLEEMRALGVRGRREGPGGIACGGSSRDLLLLHLMLRTASRILLHLAEGPVSGLGRVLRQVDFRPFLQADARFSVEIAGGGKDQGRLVREVEGAVRGALPRSERVDHGGPSLHLRIDRGRFVLRLDATGAHLHRRGYRMETGAAPLRENLAAGILSLAGWKGETPLLDPMCGSGTFLIEGAWISQGRGPGVGRTFACESWPSFPEGLSASLREELRGRELPAPLAPIVGSDVKAGALGVARRNAARAGVLSFLELRRADAAEIVPPPGGGPGLVVANPPYGKRVGERGALGPIYEGFGRALRERFSGWSFAILLMDPRLGAALRLPVEREVPLRNGGLPCTLLLGALP